MPLAGVVDEVQLLELDVSLEAPGVDTVSVGEVGELLAGVEPDGESLA